MRHHLLSNRPQLAVLLRDKLGLSVSYASELANGRRLPSLTLATRIEAEMGIPASTWIGYQKACEAERVADQPAESAAQSAAAA